MYGNNYYPNNGYYQPQYGMQPQQYPGMYPPPAWNQPRYPPAYPSYPPPVPNAPPANSRGRRDIPFNANLGYDRVDPNDPGSVANFGRRFQRDMSYANFNVEEEDEAERMVAEQTGGVPNTSDSWGYTDHEFEWEKYTTADLAYFANTLGGSSFKVGGVPNPQRVRELREARAAGHFDLSQLFNHIGRPNDRVAVATPFNSEPYLAKCVKFTINVVPGLQTAVSMDMGGHILEMISKDGAIQDLPKEDMITVVPYSAEACDVASDISVPLHVTNGKTKSNTPDTVHESVEKYNSKAHARLAIEMFTRIPMPLTTLKGPELASYVYQQIYSRQDNKGASGRLAYSMPPLFAQGAGDMRSGRVRRNRVIPGVRFVSDAALYSFQSQMSTLVGGFGNSRGQWADCHGDGVAMIPSRRKFVSMMNDCSYLPYLSRSLYAMNTVEKDAAIYLHLNLTSWREEAYAKMDPDERKARLENYKQEDPLYLAASREVQQTWQPRIPPIVVQYLSESSPSNVSTVRTAMEKGGVIAVYEFKNLESYVYIEPKGHNSPTTDKDVEISIENFSNSVKGMCDKINRLQPLDFLLIVPSIYSRGAILALSEYNCFFTASNMGHRNQFILSSFDTGKAIPKAALHTVVRVQMLIGANYGYSRLTWNHALPLLCKGLMGGQYLEPEGASEDAKQVLLRIRQQPGKFFFPYQSPTYYPVTKRAVDRFSYEITPDMLLDDEAFREAEAELARALRNANQLAAQGGDAANPAPTGPPDMAPFAARHLDAQVDLGNVVADDQFDMDSMPNN